MAMNSTSRVAVIIQATSPLWTTASTAGAAWAWESAGSASRAAGKHSLRTRLAIGRSSCAGRSDRGRAGLAGADADDLLQVIDKDLSVADLPGTGGILDRLDGLVGEFVDDGGLELDLGQEVDDVFGAAIELGMALLAAEALHLGDGDALDADRRQGLADLVERSEERRGGK